LNWQSFVIGMVTFLRRATVDVAAAVVVFVVGLGLGGSLARAQTSPVDQHFVNEAWSIHRSEIELGRLARRRATTPTVRVMGEWMVAEHTTSLQELETAADQAGAPLPTGLPLHARRHERDLARLSGTQFDRAYIDEMVTDHRLAIQTFSQEMENGESHALRSYAQKTLPILEWHEQAAVHEQTRMSHHR
jgi:putative membrane protein